MARLVTHHRIALYPSQSISGAELLLKAFQAIAIAGIAVYIGIALVNTVLGTGQQPPIYTNPVGGS